MKITVISTYPENGSKNVGDALITNTTCSALEESLGKWQQLELTTVWRAESWDNVRETINESDFIIFACLAIRPNMEDIEYPYLLKIINSGIPYGILAAGTSLTPTKNTRNQGFSLTTLQILRQVCQNAHFFTTRGVQTQQFCQQNGLTKARFGGDIAFFGSDLYKSRNLAPQPKISKIAISDPHYADYYASAFCYLLEETNLLFPEAEITVFLHGENPIIINLLSKYTRVAFLKLYEDSKHGLDAYDDIDIHIGFRVHGHVSALKRKKVSYLLEQDGRGLDYGLTIHQKISVSCPITKKLDFSLKNMLAALAHQTKKPLFRKEVSCNYVDHLLAIVMQDMKDGFIRFNQIESQIKKFDLNNREVLLTIEEINMESR